MYTVYVLQNSKGDFYKGMTNNLARRISEHKRGTTQSTKNMHGLKVIYTEEFSDRIEARNRELYLKSSAGRRFLKTKLTPL